MIPAFMLINLERKVDFKKYVELESQYYYKNISSDGTSVETIYPMQLQPCLELYGDDPDLRDSLKDFYGNSE